MYEHLKALSKILVTLFFKLALKKPKDLMSQLEVFKIGYITFLNPNLKRFSL